MVETPINIVNQSTDPNNAQLLEYLANSKKTAFELAADAVKDEKKIINLQMIDPAYYLKLIEIKKNPNYFDQQYAQLSKWVNSYTEKELENLDKDVSKWILNSKDLEDLLNHFPDNFKSAERINLSDNSIETLPDNFFSTCENLKYLDLSNNNIKDLPDWISNFNNLLELELDSNNLTSISSKIWELQELKSLDLSYNKNLKELPNEIWNLSNLEEIVLDQTWITELPENFKNLGNLKKISLVNVDFNFNNSEKIFERLINLEEINISYKPWQSLTTLPNYIFYLPNLKKINIYEDFFTNNPWKDNLLRRNVVTNYQKLMKENKQYNSRNINKGIYIGETLWKNIKIKE